MSAYNRRNRLPAHSQHSSAYEQVQFRVTREVAAALSDIARAEQRTRSSLLAKVVTDFVAAASSATTTAATPTIHHFSR